MRTESVSGQVVRVRWYSAKVFFFDVLERAGGNFSFMYRVGGIHESGLLTSSKILVLSSQIEAGDELELTYIWKPLDVSKGERSFDVYSLHITCKWSSCNQVPFDQHPPMSRPGDAPASVTATSRAPAQGELCKFWVNAGRCQLGAACTLIHSSESQRSVDRSIWLSR